MHFAFHSARSDRLAPAFVRRVRNRGFSAALRIAIVGCALAAAPVIAFAADDSEVIYPGGSEKSETAAAPKSSGLNSVTLIVGLALAGVGGWLVWRNRRGTPRRISQALAVEETRPLGNRQYLVVASYEGKKFLLGVCPGQINLLAPLHEPAAEESEHE